MKTYLLLFFGIACCIACSKQDRFLDIKSNKADVIPSSLKDYQAMLDNDNVMNSNYPSLGDLASDNYYVINTTWEAARTAQERNAYLWATEIYNGEPGFDWQYLYQQAAYANIVLEGLTKIELTRQNKSDWNTAWGAALFYRASAFYNLAQVFAKPYTPASANDPGIPLRLTSDVNILSPRATLQQTYDQIISDLKAADTLLPALPAYKTRPGKTAAKALMARVYLNMANYTTAAQYATEALALFNTLIDYNTLNPAAVISFPAYQNNNPEVIFYATSISFGITSYNNLKADTLLYRSYASNDLRKTIFYKDNGVNGIAFKGDYTGNIIPSKFSGLATNELLLTRAECYARQGNTSAALADLNKLLIKRWKTGTFIPVTATDAGNALSIILTERRKELPFTGNRRWEDLRRLNQEPLFAKTLTRTLNGQTYTLPPGNNRYVYPIPDKEIMLNGIQQNVR